MDPTAPFLDASAWRVGVGIVLVAILYETSPRWGGGLLLVLVFGMLLTASRNRLFTATP